MNTNATKQGRDSGPSVPFRTVVLSIFALWLVYFAITTMRGYIVGFEFQYEMLWRRGVVSLVGVAMTMVLWLLIRLFDRRPFWMRVIVVLVLALPIAVPIAQVNQWVFEELQAKEEQRVGREAGSNLRRDEAGNLIVDVPVKRVQKFENTGDLFAEEDVVSESVIVVPAPTDREQWVMILDIALGRYFLLLAWASLYFAMLAGYQARTAERRAGEFRNAAKAAELRSLRYQVNPHFLFNTLNSLSALVMTGKADRAERMIQTISRFYRHSLADDPTSDVQLQQEFDLQRLYLDIESVRFPERLRCVFDLPEELVDARVPGMILQPLVENSVKYAVSALNRPVTITIAAREEFDRLVISVSDDGPGVPEGASHGFGIGLANVKDRLEARFGSDVVLTSAPVPGGYKSEIRIPLTRNG
ncbi:sensor histidine kinase [Altererythrobacter sp.]|uniref:sensor histidine kinase n=1 Tax=Altererythrobacter sp. TaxID=1872480 RepID=UPI003D078670